MTLSDIVYLCRKFASYGDCVGEQIEDAINQNLTRDNWNPNCGTYLKDFLRECVTTDPDLGDEATEVTEYVKEHDRRTYEEEEEDE